MLTRRRFLQGAAAAAAATTVRPAAAQGKRPNILWLSTEDISPQLGCYGDPYAITPTLDQLAADGVRYTNVHTVAPVCAPNRSSIITGIHAATLGSEHMRAGGEGAKRSEMPALPPQVRLFPEILREGGYYCTNNSKKDYNFLEPDGAWDESSGKAHWKNCPDDTPFFAVFNFGGTHEGTVRRDRNGHLENTERLTPDQRQDPDKITPPPFHPNTPIVREQWAQYLETITALDYWIADHLAELEEAGIADNTIVIYWSDHGMGLPRGKRWLYDSGTWVPMIARIPEALRPDGFTPGTTNDRLISFLDLAPTTLHLAGMNPTPHMQGKDFLRPAGEDEWEFLYGHRDRMDERYDSIRSIRDKKFRYIRNFMYWQPYGQYLEYCEMSPIMQELRRLQAEGNLPPACTWVDKDRKPEEELYDCEADPHNINNLAADPQYAAVMDTMRSRLKSYFLDHRDTGLFPEYVLNQLGKEHGTRYEVIPALAKAEPDFLETLYTTAIGGNPDGEDSPHDAIRYWAILRGIHSGEVKHAMETGLEDGCPAIAIPATGIQLKRGNDADAMRARLAEALVADDEWERLLAAQAIDEAGEEGRPLIPQLKAALDDVHNKYVARVAQRALQELGEA